MCSSCPSPKLCVQDEPASTITSTTTPSFFSGWNSNGLYRQPARAGADSSISSAARASKRHNIDIAPLPYPAARKFSTVSACLAPVSAAVLDLAAGALGSCAGGPYETCFRRRGARRIVTQHCLRSCRTAGAARRGGAARCRSGRPRLRHRLASRSLMAAAANLSPSWPCWFVRGPYGGWRLALPLGAPRL